ncbi:LacI family transcriptional regulator [Aerococcaceae bacterium NML191292]|nr:LacI family transcriptional regulator [Aerococcaceae bacterium NML191292]
MATIKDVANRANVSKMTVSRVINHPELVTDELKELVHRAMAELDYKPNVAAKALAQNRTLVVKVLILEEMDVTEPYYMNLIAGIAKELDKYQYALQLVTENTVDFGGSDGYIITGMKEEDYAWIKEMTMPVIVFGENQHGVPFVDSDNRKGAARATRHAIEVGYEHIIFVGIDVPEQFERSREAGYIEMMTQHGKPQTLYRIKNSSSRASRLVHEIDLQPNTCFVCASDRIGIGIELGLQGLGHRVPEDYGVIGFDGVFLDQIAHPQLTTMKQDIVGMGSKCVEQLMKLIDGKSLKKKSCFFDATLINRESTRN